MVGLVGGRVASDWLSQSWVDKAISLGRSDVAFPFRSTTRQTLVSATTSLSLAALRDQHYSMEITSYLLIAVVLFVIIRVRRLSLEDYPSTPY